jgi:hypothetical protein
MAGDLGPWPAAALLRRFSTSLVASEPLADLFAHSTWALLERRGRAHEDDPALARELLGRVEALLDGGDLSAQSPGAGAGSLWRASARVIAKPRVVMGSRADA